MSFEKDPQDRRDQGGENAPSKKPASANEAKVRPEHTLPIAAAPKLEQGAPRQPASNAPPPIAAPKATASVRPESGPKTPSYAAPSPAALAAGSARRGKERATATAAVGAATTKGASVPPRAPSVPPAPRPSVPPPAPSAAAAAAQRRITPSAAPPPVPTGATTPAGGSARPRLPSIRASAAPAAPPPTATTKPRVDREAPKPAAKGPTETSVVEELSADDIAAVGPFEEQAKELVAACEAELAVETDERKRARLHFEVARLFEGPLRDTRRAASGYTEARKLAPEHVPTLQGARRVLLARKSYQSALELFDAEIRVTADPEHKAALLFEKGRVLVDYLGRRDEAKEAYLTALELAPNDASLLSALEQLQTEARDHVAVASTLGRKAQAVRTDGRLRAALLVQRARILEARAKDGESAIGHYETALRLDPHSAPAVEALKRLYHKHRRWQDLASLLVHEAEHTKDDRVRVAALYGAARITAERLGNRDEAIGQMERAAAKAGDDPMVLAALADLYEGAGRHRELVSALGHLAAVTSDVGERAGILHRIGEIVEQRLREPVDAAPWYERVLEIDPTFLPSLHALGSIYERAGRWDDLIRILTREAQTSEDPQRKAAAHARMGAIYEEHLDDTVEAIEQHQRALLAVPRHPASFKALDRLLTAAGRFRDLIRLHEHGVEHATETHHAIAHLARIAIVHEDALGEHAQAAEAYRRILERDPDHLAAIQGLQRTAERAQRYDELLRALDMEIERCQDDAQRVALLHRTGEVLENHLGDRDGALERYRKDGDPLAVLLP